MKVTMRPDEKRLQALISTAFDRLPEPDPARVKALEERLLRRASRPAGRERSARFRYWWLVAALAASGAAAWWAGEYFAREPKHDAPTSFETTGSRSYVEKRDAERPPSEDRQSEASGPGRRPDIYRREQY